MQKQGGRTVKENMHKFRSVGIYKKHIPVVDPAISRK